ncbi:MAG: putative toxin-antitoxin system toxin component, PIN family [Okeania sp. SIO2C2]|uniref:putative toxin-antitoxin system toxin component, PIN family n=1 Tax=Okeania sp. SIO2C2 TaxID=2607787 RepID=UPI0013BDF8D6|nr:putative toxin-antitoxin system toxin component, PIN family [Okeania sp. SIO2C2]NEP91257.1 putative toxin-antitoxin system toxin component, PIN family [Okeania sp. SIO2C2]
MKVIIDTNILVSAALKNKNPERVVLWVASECEWLVSVDILAEYQEVLQRQRLKINLERRERLLNLVQVLTLRVKVDVAVDFPRDRKDAKFLACALSAQADYLITGDADYSEAQSLINTKIVSVAEFINLFQINK